MSNKTKEVLSIYALTIIGAIWWYRVFKGSMIYETTTETLIVIFVALIVATIIAIVYFKIKRKP